MKKSEPESSIFNERKKLNEKTPILDKMRPSFNYSKFSDDSSKAEKPAANECCSCISVLYLSLCSCISASCCSCECWYCVLRFIIFPWAIYYYWEDIVNWYYGFWYGELPLKAMEPDMGPMVKRFRNLGNTCFYNSMNQSVNQTVLLHEMLTDCHIQPREYVIKPEQLQDEQLIVKCNTELSNLTKEACDLYCSEIAMPLWHVVVPRELLREISNRNPRFGRRKEEDSHEALRCLLDGLRMEEIDKIKDQIYAHFGVSKDPATHQNLGGEDKLKLKVYLREATKLCVPVDRVFGGVQVSTTICRECYAALQNKEKFFDMSLPLPEGKAETIGVTRYRPPVIDIHHIKNPPQGEADKEGRKSVETDHDKQQDEAKESLENLPDQTHDTIIDEDSNPLIILSPAESEHGLDSEAKPGEDNTLSNEIVQAHEVNEEHDASKEDDESGARVPKDESTVSFDLDTTQSKAEVHDDQVTSVDDVNNLLDADIEILPPEELPSEKVPLEEKVNDKKDLTDSLSTDLHQKPNPDVALNKHKLHKYLESKSLQYQMLPEGEEELDPQRLESLLTEYTGLDILDENNKFVCETCTKNRNASQDDDGNDNLTLSLVSKQIAICQLPLVLILHLKRFRIEPDSISKDTQHINFPFKLNMAPYCTTECIKEMGDCNQEIWYGLYAVVVHDGRTLEHGHYYAYVRRRPPVRSSEKPQGAGWIYDQNAAESGYWFYASDLTVRFCDRGFEEVRRERAYMLFYELLPQKTLRLHENL